MLIYLHCFDYMQDTFVPFLELFPNGIVLTNEKTEIKYVNSVMEKMFGYPKDELIGKRVEILIPESLRGTHEMHTQRFARAPRKMNMSNRHGLLGRKKSGVTFPIDVSLAPIKDYEFPMFMAIVLDLSEKEYLKALEDKNKQLEQFSYIASHDLQEPLRTILSLTHILSGQKTNGIDYRTYKSLEFINKSAQRMSDLVKALLDYSRLGKEKNLEAVDVGLMVSEILLDLEKKIDEKKAVIQYNGLPVIMAYKTELRLLFQNLISNALKFTKKNLTPMIEIIYQNKKDHHLFSIKDNGIGIAKENQEKIFDVFTRLNDKDSYEGTGIGLSHCKKIIDLHQGHIWVESIFGEGSTFNCKLKKMQS